MAEVEQFVAGDDILIPFVIDAAGSIVDLTDCEIVGEVWWRGKKRIDLTDGDGIENLTLAPDAAGEDEDQTPHGLIRITEEQSATIPPGRVAFLRLTISNAEDVTMRTGKVYLERVL